MNRATSEATNGKVLGRLAFYMKDADNWSTGKVMDGADAAASSCKQLEPASPLATRAESPPRRPSSLSTTSKGIVFSRSAVN